MTMTAHNLFAPNRTGVYGALWLAFGIVFVALLPPQLTQGQPLWSVQLSRLMLALLLAAPLFAAPLADRQRDAAGGVRWLAALAIAAAAYLPALLGVLLLSPGFPLPFLLTSMVAGMFVVLLPLLVGRRHLGKATLVMAALAVALLVVGVAFKNTANWTLSALSARSTGPESAVRAVPTALQTLRVTSYRRYIEAKVAGGGIASLGSGYLAASGEGKLFYVERDTAAGTFESLPLALAVPINHAQFFDETTQTGTTLAEHNKVAIAPTWFRVADLLVEEKDGSSTVFAVHNYWKSDEKCSVLRVSSLTAPTADWAADKVAAGWETVYETRPCQPMTNEGQGGRLVRLPDGALLLSVGVHDETNSPNAQSAESHYGKTIRIDPATKQGEVFTMGHRNPQGLTVASNGDVWQTEHGPRGGDELNRIVRGANFGWPMVSYGVQYFPGAFPASATSGNHEGFDAPTYAWVPSIGISNLVEITGDQFPLWKNDLMVASLVRTALFRARVVDRRVTYVEEIKLDERIRDLVVDRGGNLVLWTDKHSVVFVEPLGAAGSGPEEDKLLASVTIAKCSACHLTEGTTHGIGPNLRGVVGRDVAGAAGYNYSAALSGAGGQWDEARLEKFLADPQAFAPGVKVEMQAVTDAAERRRAIAWLRGLQ
jgi:aldose sugar dehydrogenase